MWESLLVQRDDAGLKEPGSALQRARGSCPVRFVRYCPSDEQRAFWHLVSSEHFQVGYIGSCLRN